MSAPSSPLPCVSVACERGRDVDVPGVIVVTCVEVDRFGRHGSCRVGSNADRRSIPRSADPYQPDPSVRTYAGRVKTCVVLLAVVLMAACAAEPPTPARTPTPVAPTVARFWSPPTVDPAVLTTGSDPVVLSVLAADPSWGFIPDWPTSAGSRACVIFGGGPARFPIPAVCWTEVEKRGSAYVVNFTQVWDGADYHGSGQLQHTWSFLVADTGAVIFQGSFGDHAPQDEM